MNNMALQSFHRHDGRCPNLRSLLFILLLAIIHIVECSPSATMMMMMNGMSPRTITSQPSTEAMFDDNFSIMPKVIDNDNRQRNLNVRNKRQLSSLLSPLQIRFGRPQMDRRISASSIKARQRQSPSSFLNGYLLPSRLQTSNHSTSSSFTGRLITKMIKNQHNLLHQFASSLNERLRPIVNLKQSQRLNNNNNNNTRTTKMLESSDTNQTVQFNKTSNKSSRRNDYDPLWYNNDIILLDDYDHENDHHTTVSGSLNDHLSSPTLNVIDDGLNNTKIAHNILIVHKNSKLQSSSNNDKFSVQTYAEPNRLLSPLIIDELEFVPIKNNHRPSTMMSLAQWKQKYQQQQQQQNKYSTKPLEVVTSSPTTSNSLKPSEDQNDNVDDNQMPTSYAASSSSLFPSTYVPRISSPSSSASSITTTSSPVTKKSFDNRRSTVTIGHNNNRIPSTTTKAQLLLTNWPSMIITTATMTNQTSTVHGLFASTTIKPQHDDNEQATWNVHSDDYHGQLITSNPINMDNDGDSSATLITENPSTTLTNMIDVADGATMDDNTFEMLKEFNEQLKEINRTTSNPIDLYNGQSNSNDAEIAAEKQEPNLDDPTIIVFKNNHIKPFKKRPITQKPPTSRYTGKPPYATIFNYPTTTAMPSRRTSISFANVSGYRVKQPEEIKSATLTILDPPYSANGMQLPINTTIVHNNLLVPMKEGRPKPKFPIRTTTTYPSYPIMTGSHWNSQTTPPWYMTTVTTNSPDRFDDEMIAIPSENNYTMIENDFNSFATAFQQYNLTTTTTISPSTIAITKKIYKAPTVYTYRPQKLTTTTTTTTPRPSHQTHKKRPSMFHAINAPPMPIIRPPVSIVQSNHMIFTNLMSRLRKFWTSTFPAPMSGSPHSILGFLRSTVYSLMVMLLPPIALMTFFA